LDLKWAVRTAAPKVFEMDLTMGGVLACKREHRLEKLTVAPLVDLKAEHWE
jgi:hypothetical protein